MPQADSIDGPMTGRVTNHSGGAGIGPADIVSNHSAAIGKWPMSSQAKKIAGIRRTISSKKAKITSAMSLRPRRRLTRRSYGWAQMTARSSPQRIAGNIGANTW